MTERGWKNRQVLVTGGGGFIGSHLVESLAGLGARVRTFVRYNSRGDRGLLELLPRDHLDETEVIMGDLRDADAVRRAAQNVEIVFHLGALISIPYSYIHPRETVETNIMGTLNVLNAARDTGAARVVHTSSSEVYGTALYVPIDEKHPLQGQSPYSASKIGADMLAESYYRAFGLAVTTIRPFNAYGPGQSARAVIPTIISQALTQDRITLGSLKPTRDYTYVADTVDAFLKIGLSTDAVGEVFNIGSNFEISIGDIAQKVMSLTGKKLPIETDPGRLRPEKSEVARLWCDNTKAIKRLGWTPQTGFEDGLKTTIKWISDHPGRYRAGDYNI